MIVNVDFSGTWLTSLLDDSQAIRLLKQDPRQEDDALGGQIVNYAGRTTAEYGTARTRTTPLKFVKVTGDQLEQLRAWCGLPADSASVPTAPTPLLMRDGSGWRRPGVLFGFSALDMFPWDRTRRLYRVSVTFSDVSYTEGV